MSGKPEKTRDKEQCVFNYDHTLSDQRDVSNNKPVFSDCGSRQLCDTYLVPTSDTVYGFRLQTMLTATDGPQTASARSATVLVAKKAVGLSIGYVEQTLRTYDDLSGAQRFNKALALQPDILLLEEPTNHLDLDNKKSLIKMLKRYQGTLIIVSHETSLLSLVDYVWHIKDGNIHIFSCSYEEYMNNRNAEKNVLLKELKSCAQERKNTHNKLMYEQDRSKKRKAYGQRKYQGTL